MQLLILVQLLDGPKYGYEILSNLRKDFEGVWDPQTGTIYPALKSMNHKGLVSKHEKQDHTYYTLSDEGQELLLEIGDWVNEFLLFGSKFIYSVLRAMPQSYAERLFTNIHLSGVNEVIPEGALVSELGRFFSRDQHIEFLKMRQKALKEKLTLIEQGLKEYS